MIQRRRFGPAWPVRHWRPRAIALAVGDLEVALHAGIETDVFEEPLEALAAGPAVSPAQERARHVCGALADALADQQRLALLAGCQHYRIAGACSGVRKLSAGTGTG